MNISAIIITLIVAFVALKLVKHYEKFWDSKHIVENLKIDLINIFIPEVKQVHSDYISNLEKYKSDLMSEDPDVRENAIEKLLNSAYQNSNELSERLKLINLNG